MRFSWTGLILAPLLVPLVFSATMLSLVHESRPVAEFLFLMALSCIVSYGTTIFLFLPSLFVLSLRRPLTGIEVGVLGFALGALAFVLQTLMAWKGSGPDSGPPTESFLAFLVRWAADPFAAMYPAAGMVTAGLYWWLGTWRRGRAIASSGDKPAA